MVIQTTVASRQNNMVRSGISIYRRIIGGPLLLALALLVTGQFGAIPAFPISSVQAQDDFAGDGSIFPNVNLGGFGGESENPADWSARYVLRPGTDEGVLEVEALLGRGWHVNSTTQPPGGPLPTKITIEAPQGAQLSAAFTPDRPPARSVSKIFKGITIEEFSDSVLWSAPIIVPPGFRGDIQVAVDGLTCTDAGKCIPVEEVLTAKYDGDAPSGDQKQTVAADAKSAEDSKAAKPKVFRDGKYVVGWTATAPKAIAPGETARLRFTATPDAKFHVYAAVTDDADSSTNFVITKKSDLKIAAPTTDEPVISKKVLPTLPAQRYYKGKVTWSLPVKVPEGTEPGEHDIEGFIVYQACTDNACHPPMALKFKTAILVGDGTGRQDIQLVSAKRAEALDAAGTVKWVDDLASATPAITPENTPDGSDNNSDVGPAVAAIGSQSTSRDASAAPVADAEATTPFALILLLAFAGGVILNVMPCVLPVVGLKIMSFVKQAGEDQRRVFILNLVYVAGILFVFALLAALAVMFSFAWGEQFTFFSVRLGLAIVLFALALSYLDVWEIPVPGMAAGKASQEIQNREGYIGAFSKGMFATILATPCSGPMLGAIFGLTLGLTPVQTVAIFMVVGLGMSLPYVIIGAKPSLVSWLPKPGNWMETLKQFLAFLFLGTVAFFFAGFEDNEKTPLFITLIGVWFGCWIIGQVPNWDRVGRRFSAWVVGVTTAVVIGVGAFQFFDGGEKILKWEPYSEARLAQLQSEGKTVMLDFTANWCVNCQVNTKFAIDTEPTRKLVQELDAVAMIADWSNRDDPSIKKKLEELQSRSIPLLAIYPGDQPDQPIILRDLVSQGSVLEALRQAGPSLDRTANSSAQPPIASLTH
ncbi:MAG: disulfide bond formation protein DsbD [Pirellulaceae bacterium]|nr:disulfide bond formation protein DsbD [Pirellulaceae bacterium]